MHRDLEDLLAREGVITRASALRRVSRRAFEHAISTGAVVRLLPSTYVHSDRLDDVGTRERAALLYAGDGAVLSHTSALRRWGLPIPPNATAVHVIGSASRYRRPPPDIAIIHTSRNGVAAIGRGGMPVTRMERSVVDSWAVLTGSDQRAPAIAAVAERMTTPQRLIDAAAERSNLKDRASLLELCDALRRGCRSELELWGLRSVFHDARFAHGVWQLPVRLSSRVVYLDLAFERERVCVELDGATYHRLPMDRERDMRRDAALSMLGWLVLRFSYHRLHQCAEEVTDEVDAILETRRRQLGVA